MRIFNNAKDSHIFATKNNSVIAYVVGINLTNGCLNRSLCFIVLQKLFHPYLMITGVIFVCLQAIQEQMKLHGQEPVSFQDVKDEIFDMVKPRDPLHIRLEDLITR